MERRKEKIIFGVIMAIFVFGLLLAIIADLLIGEDLVMYLEPSSTSANANFGNQTTFNFTMRTNYRLFCSAGCTYLFIDQSAGAVVDNGTLNVAAGSSFSRNYSIKLLRRGKGQYLYNFEVGCRNDRAFGCITNSEYRVGSALATINYDFTEHELKLKEELGRNISSHIQQASQVYSRMLALEEQISNLDTKTKLYSLDERRKIANEHAAKLALEAENLRSLWNEQDYFYLEQVFRNSTQPDNFFANQLNESLLSIVLEHNEASDYISYILLAWDFNEMMILAAKANNTALFGNITTAAGKLNYTIFQFSSLNYSNLTEITNLLDELNSQLENLEIEAQNESSKVLELMETALAMELEKDCRLKGVCKTLNASCDSLANINNQHEHATYSHAENLLNQTKNSTLAGAAAYGEMMSLLNISMLLQNPPFMEELNSLSFNLSGGKELSLNQTLRLALNTTTGETYKKAFLTCSVSIKPISITEHQLRIEIIQSNQTTWLNNKLGEPLPQCCIFGECRPCCTEPRCRTDPDTFPVIFIHGHSFNSKNSPEFTATAFGAMQKELRAEGYINAGILSESLTKPGEWGLSGKPITVSISYYLDSEKPGYSLIPRQSQEITTYSVRLGELIEQVKMQTGRDKVNIIAHSMGGLVSRNYIAIFGNESVDKLIMIGTPNHGIRGTIDQFCGFFGEEKECEDLAENSFFIRKLNSRPINANVHNIIGIGCDTDGIGGDGTVDAESSFLEGAKNYYVEGTCSGIHVLHTDLIHPESKPEVIDLIKKILKE